MLAISEEGVTWGGWSNCWFFYKGCRWNLRGGAFCQRGLCRRFPWKRLKACWALGLGRVWGRRGGIFGSWPWLWGAKRGLGRTPGPVSCWCRFVWYFRRNGFGPVICWNCCECCCCWDDLWISQEDGCLYMTCPVCNCCCQQDRPVELSWGVPMSRIDYWCTRTC